MGRAKKRRGRRGRKGRNNDQRAEQAVAVLIQEWRDLKYSPIRKRIDWLNRPEAIVGLGSQDVRDLLESLKGHCKDLRKRCCPAPVFIDRSDAESGSPNFDNVINDGSPEPLGRVPCRCDNCRGKVLWPASYVGSRGFSYECELEAVPADGNARLQLAEKTCSWPSSPSGRIMRLIRIFKKRPRWHRTKLGWKRGSKRTQLP